MAGAVVPGAEAVAAGLDSGATRPGRHFNRLLEAHAAAVAATGAVERELAIGGRGVSVCLAGDALLPALLPALDHLSGRSAPAGRALTLLAWDEASTGVELPLPWRRVDVRERGLVRGFNDARFSTLYETNFGGVMMFDAATRTGVFATGSAAGVPWYERAAPVRALLHWALAAPERQLLHAGAVGWDGAGVLLAGPAGRGKSTTSVACLAAGLEYAGDDYVLLDLGGREPLAHSVYSSAKLNHDSLALLEELAAAVDNPVREPEEKAVLQLHRTAAERIATTLPIRAVVMPQLGDAAGTLRRITGGEALLGIGPSTVLQLPGAATALELTARLLRDVPAYELTVGADVAAGPRAIRKLLAGGAA